MRVRKALRKKLGSLQTCATMVGMKRIWVITVLFVAACNVGYDTDAVTLRDVDGGDSGADATCVAQSDVVLCASVQAECGAITSVDNCGSTRTIANCGLCADQVPCDSNRCGEAVCNNGRDDDGDLKVDCADEDCVGRKCLGNRTCSMDGQCI